MKGRPSPAFKLGQVWGMLTEAPAAAGRSILGSPCTLPHVPTFGALIDDVIRDIGAGASQNRQHANSGMVIEHELAVLLAVRYLGTPVALPISEYAKELARRHAVMLSIDPHPDEFLKVHRARRFGVLAQPAATAVPFSHIER
jgi:hypothetical protein